MPVMFVTAVVIYEFLFSCLPEGMCHREREREGERGGERERGREGEREREGGKREREGERESERETETETETERERDKQASDRQIKKKQTSGIHTLDPAKKWLSRVCGFTPQSTASLFTKSARLTIEKQDQLVCK